MTSEQACLVFSPFSPIEWVLWSQDWTNTQTPEGHSLKLLFIVHMLIMHAIVMSTTPEHHAVAMAIKGLPWQVYIA